MRKFTLLAIAFLIIAGCSKNQLDTAKIDEAQVSKTLSETAREDFSIILSRAVSSDKNLRRFIKENALKQFDRDYELNFRICERPYF